ncbi:MAG: hypothetical protein KGH63_03345 [Candidatus Micrarchaeota archaeon]|nr:hypothetical protein [Candidatus Micrarchaeota archaeon]
MRKAGSSNRVLSRKKVLRGKAKSKALRGKPQSMRDKGCSMCGGKCEC